MNTIEQDLLNFLDVGSSIASKLVVANNPAYAGVAALVGSTIDEINTSMNSSATATAATDATTIAGAVSASIPAVETVGSGAASATEKASAIGTLIGTLTSFAGELISIFHNPATGTVTAVVPAHGTATGTTSQTVGTFTPVSSS